VSVRSKHPSDEAFESWVDGADQLRTHSIQAAFREAWAKGEERAALACPHTGTVERLRSALVEIMRIIDHEQPLGNGHSLREVARIALAG
jgi:hypothetical protein